MTTADAGTLAWGVSMPKAFYVLLTNQTSFRRSLLERPRAAMRVSRLAMMSCSGVCSKEHAASSARSLALHKPAHQRVVLKNKHTFGLLLVGLASQGGSKQSTVTLQRAQVILSSTQPVTVALQRDLKCNRAHDQK